MSSHIQTFIVNNIQTYDKDIEFIHKHNTKDKPLNILFSGAIDKFVCISWFYETNLNCLWIKDNVPYNTYTNPKFKELIKKYSDNYPSAIMFGMSMGGLGALLHSQYIANCAAVNSAKKPPAVDVLPPIAASTEPPPSESYSIRPL